MALLVTGGAGFVGSHFVRAAREEGRRVVVFDDLSGSSRASLPPDVPVIVADIGDKAAVLAAARGYDVDAIVHFAGKIQVGESMRAPERYFDVNLVRSLALLDAAREAGVPRFVFSSSAAVYGAPAQTPIPEGARLAPVNPYGASKLALELALEAYSKAHGLKYAALRYFNAAGAHPDGSIPEAHEPETHLIPLVIDAGLGRIPPITIFGVDYPTPDGTCVRDYVHVQDLAAAHLAALRALDATGSVGPMNIGTGIGYSVRQIIDAAARIMDRPIPHVEGPRREGDPPILVADPSLAGRILGWKPIHSAIDTILEDALRARRGR